MVGTVRRATVSLTPVIVFSSDLKSDTRPRSVLQPNSEQPNNEIVSLMSYKVFTADPVTDAVSHE